MKNDVHMTRLVAVTPFREYRFCPCGGSMTSTGTGRTRLLSEYLHACDECGEEAWLTSIYPRILFKEDGQTENEVNLKKRIIQLESGLKDIVAMGYQSTIHGTREEAVRFSDDLTQIAESTLAGVKKPIW